MLCDWHPLLRCCSLSGSLLLISGSDKTASLALDIFSPNLSGLKTTSSSSRLLRLCLLADERDFMDLAYGSDCINSSVNLLEKRQI